jgi:hypothetical protein
VPEDQTQILACPRCEAKTAGRFCDRCGAPLIVENIGSDVVSPSSSDADTSKSAESLELEQLLPKDSVQNDNSIGVKHALPVVTSLQCAAAAVQSEALTRDEKECPFCAEAISSQATVCQFCDEPLVGGSGDGSSIDARTASQSLLARGNLKLIARWIWNGLATVGVISIFLVGWITYLCSHETAEDKDRASVGNAKRLNSDESAKQTPEYKSKLERPTAEKEARAEVQRLKAQDAAEGKLKSEGLSDEAKAAAEVERLRVQEKAANEAAAEAKRKEDEAVAVKDVGKVFEGDTCMIVHPAPVADTIDDYKEMEKAKNIGDNDGIAQLANEGKIAMLEPGTKVLMLEEKIEWGRYGLMAKVRPLNGDLAHRAVWIEKYELMPVSRGRIYEYMKAH